MKNVEFLSAKDAVEKIESGSRIATGGFVGVGVPETILKALEKRFLETGMPKNLNLIYAAGQGDGKEKGLNRFGYEGMVDTVIGGHWGLAPKLGKLAFENKIKGYNLPQGVISQLFRDIAAGKPGTISKVGIGTFVDPELEGGKVNSATTEEIVSKINILNEDYLFFKGVKIDVAIIRGTSADESGNISMEKEALKLEAQAIAMAARNSGGKVIVQVERKVKGGSIDPKLVEIPGIMVDYVVLAESQEDTMQTFGTQFKEEFVTRNIVVDTPVDNIFLE